MSVASSLLGTPRVNFMYLLLLTAVTDWKCQKCLCPFGYAGTAGAGQRSPAARSHAKDLWQLSDARVLQIYVRRTGVSFVSLKEVALAVMAFDRPILYIMSKDHHVKGY